MINVKVIVLLLIEVISLIFRTIKSASKKIFKIWKLALRPSQFSSDRKKDFFYLFAHQYTHIQTRIHTHMHTKRSHSTLTIVSINDNINFFSA